jgi:hypothetical protein
VHARTVRPLGADRPAVRQGTPCPVPGRGPSASLQRAPPPVLTQCLAPEKVSTPIKSKQSAKKPLPMYCSPSPLCQVSHSAKTLPSVFKGLPKRSIPVVVPRGAALS